MKKHFQLPSKFHQKQFNRNLVSLPTFISEDLPSGRVYHIEEKRYPSITTVLSVLSEKAIEKWKSKVGIKKSTEITNKTSVGGSTLHEMTESYLMCNEVQTTNIQFNVLKQSLDKIDNIVAQEQTLCSNIYCVAGRVDCIAEYDGKLSVIDFKTSLKPKRKEWITGYFIQTTFYAIAFEEMTGQKIDDLVILMVTADGQLLVFEEKKENWISQLAETIDLYNLYACFNTQNTI